MQAIIRPFEAVPSHEWHPSDDILDILSSWLSDYSCEHILNRVARVILTRINYDHSTDNKVHLQPKGHRIIALLIYKAIISHTKVEDSMENYFRNSFTGFDLDYALKRAKGKTISAFLEWSWRILLLLKLHIRDYPNYEIEAMLSSESDQFGPIPNILTDCEMFSICKGYEAKNAFALYLAIVMSEMGHL